jgi:hypothetical protein
MAGFSDYLEKLVLDHLFGKTTYTAPSTVYIALATAAITDATTGSTITEPSGNNYSRLAVTNNTTNFPNALGTTATKSNGTAFTFATPSGSWGTVTDFAICDAASAGNILGSGTLITPKTIGASDPVSFSAGQLTITLD